MSYTWVNWMVVSIAVLVTVFGPKRLPAHENFFLWAITAAFAEAFDYLVAGTFNQYDYGPTPEIDISDVAQVVLVNPCLGLMLLNFWPERKAFPLKLLYWGIWIGGLILMELLWLRVGLIRYNDWSIWKSMMCYPLLFVVLRLSQLAYRRSLPK
ncbi:hypothetical protein JJB07_11720 [Tumebacillus sp. ITR2]|uniref:Rod shape-determining protein MreD n=1 Tax=Tumebacillus amylolyticus TaxID=2801339 RepID=A0ABS1JAW1_9BACL|nr:CBO0543 family protein [Tumebacillus amylolyticus]MBL0387320.1 hypothetical protein [Tumebacillus amylolyticus]